MRKTTTTDGTTLELERNARLKAVNEALDAAGIPRSAYFVPDLTAHTVNIPAALLMTLARVAKEARAVEVLSWDFNMGTVDLEMALSELDAATKMFDPNDLVCGQLGQKAEPKPKRVLSPEHKAKLQAGRARARNSEPHIVSEPTGELGDNAVIQSLVERAAE
jgi:hypothetical protein